MILCGWGLSSSCWRVRFLVRFLGWCVVRVRNVHGWLVVSSLFLCFVRFCVHLSVCVPCLWLCRFVRRGLPCPCLVIE